MYVCMYVCMYVLLSVILCANALQDALLDDESRRLIAMQQRLEEETERARVLQTLLQGNLTALEQQQEQAAGREC